MDAVVANTYGLDRGDYEHILGSFSHKSFRRAPEFCLGAFDELTAAGLAAFCHDNDPFFQIELRTALARPVLSLNAVSGRQHTLRVAHAGGRHGRGGK